MKLYKLESIRNYFQTKLSKDKDYQKIKNDISQFFSPEFLINHYLLDRVLLDKHYTINMLISEELFSEHLSKFNEKFNFNLDLNTRKVNKFSSFYNEKDYIIYDVKETPVNFNNILNEHYKNKEIREIIHSKKESMRIEKERKIHFKSAMVEDFPNDLERKKILSIDFEYDKETLYEVGISLYHNGLTLNKYYITNLKQGSRDNQFQYKFGESMVVSEANIIRLLKRYLNQSDYLLLHGGYNDILILNKFNVELSDYPNLKILDTYQLYPKYFNEGKIDNSSLVSILQRFEINHEHLHNAGNDSNYTLKAFLRMSEAHFNNEIISKKRTKIKNKI